MKCQPFSTLLVLFTLWCGQAGAQITEPKEPRRHQFRLFQNLPEKQSLRLANLQALLDLPVGASVNTTLANGLALTGTVVSKSDPADTKVKTVIVRSTTHKDAILSFSRVVRHDGTIAYAGRLFSRTSDDALEFAREGNSYVVRKKDYNDLVNE